MASLSASCRILESSLSTLDSGISDLPRLNHILKSTRHFELLPESEVLAAHRELRAEIEPQRDELLRRAEKAVQGLERREYSLKSKKELQQVRLQQRPAAVRAQEIGQRSDDGQENRANLERLRTIKAHKERLGYTLKRIHMEEQGRKNRMSLAPGGFSM